MPGHRNGEGTAPAVPSLTIFSSDCGHRFIGDTAGSFACPLCGRSDGDHHLTDMDRLPVQLDDAGCWEAFFLVSLNREPNSR